MLNRCEPRREGWRTGVEVDIRVDSVVWRKEEVILPLYREESRTEMKEAEEGLQLEGKERNAR